MRPLPSEPYIPAIWSTDLKVGNDYLFSDGLNKYSVPFVLIGEKVNLRLTRDTVEVFTMAQGLPCTHASTRFYENPS